MRVLVACEFSGVVRDAFRQRGHDAYSCDILPSADNSFHLQCDAIDAAYQLQWDMMIAHPPCTYLSAAGNKWMKPEFKERWPNREQDRQDAIDFFMALIEAPIDKIAVENPVGIMSSVYRKPDQYIDPYMFGHPFTKKTGYWLKNLPLLIPTNIVEPEWFYPKKGKKISMEHYHTGHMKPEERWRARSITPKGIAEAMADQWGG